MKKLLGAVKEALVVEELEPFVETHVKAIANEADIRVKIHGKDLLPVVGELSTRKVTEALASLTKSKSPVNFSELDRLNQDIASLLPLRPPTLCPGCPHRSSQYAMKVAGRRVAREIGKDIEAVYTGDIGCYTLSYLPPLESMDTTICMGASFGVANGLAHVIDTPIIAQLGDSTFFHSGIAPMINAVFNNAKITMVVLDNTATAMTGFQPHPGTGYTALGEKSPMIKPEDVAKACGVKSVEVVDPFDFKKAVDVFERAIRFDGPSVVVLKRPCAMIEQRMKKERGEAIVPCLVDQEKCDARCGACIKLLGCPAIIKEDGRVVIDASLCTGCGLCAYVCPHKAIVSKR
ncbi:MAG: thiamine pyrophosphate-dependent enzyme [Chloroflexota bacterium]|nr:thiamine pyrophosphate-dependent enzyme [Chloroflexota bacterium]